MKKRFLILLFLLLILLPIKINAISKEYHDEISEIVSAEVSEDKINLYLFHGNGCPHCKDEFKWLESLEKKYSEYINIYKYEIWDDLANNKLMEEVKESLKIARKGVPLTIIGDKYYVGFSDTISSRIESQIKDYLEIDNNKDEVKIPILGKINMKTVSIPLVAVILGFIDGFNPCAMWILLFLINLLFGMNDRKKAWILGITFLLISAFVYFLSMLGINFVLDVVSLKWMKIAIAIVILIAGIANFRKYFIMRKKENGCSVVDEKKRKNIITRMQKIISNKSFLLAFLGIILLAASINLIELACSLGFPLVFTEILSINNIAGITKIIYLLLYILFYMIDDLVVFIISMVTVEVTGITNKYNKLCTLVSAIIMIIMGLLLLFKPEWLMMNF